MIHHHDFSRFRLLDGEVPTYHAAFNMGMEGQITDRRFIYRDVQSGESWPVELATIQAASVFGYDSSFGWTWDVRIRCHEHSDPDALPFERNYDERDTFGDLTLRPC